MKAKVNWLWYWHRFNKERAAHFVARHLPKRVRYWSAVVSASKVNPNGNPGTVTVLDMMSAETVS